MLEVTKPSEIRSKFTIHSGGALGADTVFGKIAEQYNLTVKHYCTGNKSQFNAPNGNTEITSLDYFEGQVKAAEAAKYNWGYPYKTMKDTKLIRNWAQVKYSTIIYAVGTLVDVGEKIFPSFLYDTRVALNQCATGVTGYAITMGILNNKPVYVFDQTRNKWTYYHPKEKSFCYCDCPKLVEHSAGIGTRNINMNGIQAINQLFINTFGELNA